MGTPEFAPALGVQLSVLAREGVQEARLHLNPAEMGPIAVQIAVDGSTAVVHFQADVAATRQALESSLPDLAAAMRDNGFTLSGGSVSSQSSGGQGAGGRGSDDRGAQRIGGVQAAAGTGTAEAAAPVRLSAPQAARLRGGVDVFA
jgi:flagellar hook-length control protein FliK